MKRTFIPPAVMAGIALIASAPLNANGAQTTCGNWTLDYRLAPDGSDTDIIVTKATGSGDLDLTMVKGFNIVGALSSAFAYNSGLTSVVLPASLTSLSAALSDKQQITGSGTPYTASSPTTGSNQGIGIINLGYNLNEQAVRIILDVTTDGAAFNEHGSCLLASGTEPFLDGGYEGGFQLFLESQDEGHQTLTVKDGSSVTGKKFSHATGSHFQLELYYNPHYRFMMTSVRYEDGTVETLTFNPSDFSVDTLCYGLPVGVNESITISDACMPFAGCSALLSIQVTDGSTTFSNGQNGELLDAPGQTIAAYPYGRLFNTTVRIRSASAPSTCLSVDAYAAGGGYEDRSADFQSPDSHFGTTLFRIEANANGTCSFRHLNTGFLLGKKSDNTNTTLDVVQDPTYSGQYDYTLLPGSPLDARFVFTDPYTGPVELFDGIWCITDADGKAILQKNVSMAAEASSFNIIKLNDIDIPLNDCSLASICLPVNIVAPDEPIQTFTVSGYNASTHELITNPITPGTIVSAGTGLLFRHPLGMTSISIPISQTDSGTNPSPNMLSGTNLRIPDASGTNYIFQTNYYQEQTNANIPANTAYLKSTSLSSAAAAENVLPLPSEISTETNDINCTEETQIESDDCYDIFGNRVDAASAHGIIISGGHKYYKQ